MKNRNVWPTLFSLLFFAHCTLSDNTATTDHETSQTNTQEVVIEEKEENEETHTDIQQVVTPEKVVVVDKAIDTAYLTQTEAKRWLSLANQYRAKDQVCGSRLFKATRPLVWVKKLEVAARLHCEDMAKNHYFSHDGLDGRGPYERMVEQGYDAGGGAENIGEARSLETVFSLWMGSPIHCSNIMNPRLTDLGIGSHQNFWTLLTAISY